MFQVQGVRIGAIYSVAPENTELNSDLVDGEIFLEDAIRAVEVSTGIRSRHIAAKGVTSADLCLRAAEGLIREMGINKEDIGTVVFVTQSPDYRVPSTSPWIASQLGLGLNVACFDINLACSGYVYGLWVASGLSSSSGKKYSLLLVGETMSRLISKRDRGTTPLFGDAGSATLLEVSTEVQPFFFDLNSDGTGVKAIYSPTGGGRQPASEADGTTLDMQMDGLEVFNFTLREVPKSIKRMLAFLEPLGRNPEGIVFHQANKLIMDHIRKRVGYAFDWVPFSLEEFGNTSAVSIPLTICHNHDRASSGSHDSILLCGYGAGLSWATACVSLGGTRIFPVEYYA